MEWYIIEVKDLSFLAVDFAFSIEIDNSTQYILLGRSNTYR